MRFTTVLHLSVLISATLPSAGCSSEELRSSLAGVPPLRAQDERSGEQRQYGPPQRVGNGRARAYVTYDRADGGVPREIGIALDEAATEGLPAPRAIPARAGHGEHGVSHSVSPGAAQGGTPGVANEHEHLDNHVYLLTLPPRGVAPFQFVELDWNPGGHEPPGVYDIPHFDFHFWTESRELRASIVPTNPDFQAKAEALPPESQRPLYYAMAAPPGEQAPAVPLMGVHWADVRSPELQPPQAPSHRAFTTTFLYGSWDGRFVFLEPMITRDYIMAKRASAEPVVRDELIPIATPLQVRSPGYYPSAYRITWDAQAREYRIALTNLAPRG